MGRLQGATHTLEAHEARGAGRGSQVGGDRGGRSCVIGLLERVEDLTVSVGLALSGWWSLAGTMWLGQADGMTPASATYPGHRFPAEIISHAVSRVA